MPEPSLSCAAIVLAAGASARLGQPKQLLCFRGEPLVRSAARLALTAGALPVFVIVPAAANAACVEALDGLPVTVVVNPEASEGMGSSLRLGMAALAGVQPQPGRVLLMVCDQPLLRPEHLLALLTAEAPGGIAAAGYGDPPRLGVPAVFSREHFAALAAASGDEGARGLLRSGRASAVPVPEAAVDIDTPADLLALEQQ